MSTGMLSKRLGLVLGAALIVSSAATAMVVADLTVNSAPASAASSVGGNITRSEIMQRAENWYSRRGSINYDMSGNTMVADGSGSRKYRPDCSGFVGMAWHLNADPATTGLDDSTYTTVITRSQLLPGDLLNDTTTGESGYPYHAILFGGWQDTAKTKFWYYSFGHTPIVKVFNATFSQSTMEGHPTSHYKAYRYKKVIGESWTTPTQYCNYRINSAAPERTGPGNASPAELTRAAGSYLYIGTTGTVYADGKTWHHVIDNHGADESGGWIDGALITRSTPCYYQ